MNSIFEGNRKNKEILEKNKYRKADCCQNCQRNSKSTFRDRVGCHLLDWTHGNQVIPTHICDGFKREVST